MAKKYNIIDVIDQEGMFLLWNGTLRYMNSQCYMIMRDANGTEILAPVPFGSPVHFNDEYGNTIKTVHLEGQRVQLAMVLVDERIEDEVV